LLTTSKETITAELFDQVLREVPEDEWVTLEDGLRIRKLPEWMNAVREKQDNGRPGFFLIRPSKEDFEERFEEMMVLLEPIGVEMGAVKIGIPNEW
jgi:hypothetical protein